MLTENMRSEIAKATVKFQNKVGGQGVLMEGKLIVTAAHCIDWNVDGSMLLEDDKIYIEDIETSTGTLKVQPRAVEPISDVAVLGALDEQLFYEDYMAFEEFCKKTKPISLCLSEFELFKPVLVFIYTQKGSWVEARAQRLNDAACHLEIKADEQIEGGNAWWTDCQFTR